MTIFINNSQTLEYYSIIEAAKTRETSTKNLLADGTHHLLGGEIQRRMTAEGRNPLSGGKIQRERIANGTHQNCQIHTCPHCGKVGQGPGMFRHHFDRCKFKK